VKVAAARIVPGNHTPGYMAGCKDGSHYRALSPPVSPPPVSLLQGSGGGGAAGKRYLDPKVIAV
jgi:hypothetical protein